MCGIAGAVGALSGAQETAVIGRRMLDLLAHRGPDGQGSHTVAHANCSHTIHSPTANAFSTNVDGTLPC